MDLKDPAQTVKLQVYIFSIVTPPPFPERGKIWKYKLLPSKSGEKMKKGGNVTSRENTYPCKVRQAGT